MKKDKEWLREEIKFDLGKLNWKGKLTVIDASNLTVRVNHLIDQLEEPEKPVIPKFVADWIVRRKGDFKNGFDAARYLMEYGWDDESSFEFKIYEWIKGKERIFIEAFDDGYEVEKEKLYTVCFEDDKNVYRTGIFLYKDGEVVNSGNAMQNYDKEDNESHLTEKEIKDYDERFWQFAEPVEEEAE